MAKQVCATLSSFKRLAAFEQVEQKLKGAPRAILSLLDQAWDIEQEIFETSLPNSKAGAALKLQNVLDISRGSDDPLPQDVVSSLRKLKTLLENGGTRQQLQGRAKTVRALLPQVKTLFISRMIQKVLAAIEYDYSEFGQEAVKAKSAGRRRGKAGRDVRNAA